MHLRCVEQRNFTELTAKEVSLILAIVEVSDVQVLFDESQERGSEFSQAPTKQPWGQTVFHIRDLNRNAISFVSWGSCGRVRAGAISCVDAGFPLWPRPVPVSQRAYRERPLLRKAALSVWEPSVIRLRARALLAGSGSFTGSESTALGKAGGHWDKAYLIKSNLAYK